jgi:hypothetical protein
MVRPGSKNPLPLGGGSVSQRSARWQALQAALPDEPGPKPALVRPGSKNQLPLGGVCSLAGSSGRSAG